MVTACVNDDDENDGTTAIVNVGDVVPDFALHGSDGMDVFSASLDGQPYILNFFDTRCKDCQEVLPVLQQIYDKFQGKVPVLNVPRSQAEDEVQAYWDKEGLSLPFYMPSDKNLYYKFAKSIVPRTYIVDASGKVIMAFNDSPTADFETLDSTLKQIVGEVTDKKGDVRLSIRVASYLTKTVKR